MVDTERGQVLLLGGLAIAIVFLTAIPLSNSLVVSESASSSETVSDIDRVAEREAGVERGVHALLADVNTSDSAAVNQSLRNFSKYYTNVSGRTSGVYVDATANVSASQGGVVNSSTDFKEFDGNNKNWRLIDNATRISAFRMRINETDGGSGSNLFRVNISNATGARWQLRVDESGGNKTVEYRSTQSGIWLLRCNSSSHIRIDLQSGTCTENVGTPSANTESFPTYTDFVEEPYQVRFENGQKPNKGSYRLVGVGDFPHGSNRQVVFPAIDLTYVGPDVTYERTILVNETS